MPTLKDPYDEKSAQIFADTIMRMKGMARRLQLDAVPEFLKERVNELIRGKENANNNKREFYKNYFRRAYRMSVTFLGRFSII